MTRLIVVGLGPSTEGALSARATEVLLAASSVLVSRYDHPVARWLTARSKNVTLLGSRQSRSTATTSQDLATQLFDRVKREGQVVYGVPGNPLVDDDVVPIAASRARAAGVAVEVIPAVSYFDESVGRRVMTASGSGWQVFGPASLADAAPEHDPGAGAFRGVYRLVDPTRPWFVGPLFDAVQLDRARQWLVDQLAPNHHVAAVEFSIDGETRESVAASVGALTWQSSAFALCLVGRPIERLDDLRSFDTLRYIVARLRAPNGCPWDREQTYVTMKKHLLEEAYEAIDALDQGDFETFAAELGDVLLQVVMYGQFGREAGDFSLDDVIAAINRKLIRRHPHVFGDVNVSDSAEVLLNWERIKRAEKPGTDSTFSGVPQAAPSLVRADAIQSRATRYGWVDQTDATRLLPPEIVAADVPTRARYLGHLLFDLVAIARRDRVDAEEGLRLATNRFRDAFDRVLASCRTAGVPFDSLSAEERTRRLESELGIEGQH